MAQARYLTREEINHIVNSLPKPRTADQRETGLSALIHEQMKSCLAFYLRDIPVVPETIPDLVREIVRYYSKAEIEPGDSVGTRAAQYVGEPCTQGKLKDFSSTGSLKARSYNADRIDELLANKKTQRYRNMTIIFENKHITYEEVLDQFRPKIVGITLKNLVKNHETLNVNDPTFDQVPRDWWPMYEYMFGFNHTTMAPTFLRLHLDVDRMFKYRITPPKIVNAIRAGNNGKYIHVITSPSVFGVLDIFIDPRAEITVGSGKEQVTVTIRDASEFIENILLPAIIGDADNKQIQISGIKGIVDMLPSELSLISLFTDAVDLGDYQGQTVYDVFVNVKQEALLGIPRIRLENALRTAGCTIIEIPPEEQGFVTDLTPCRFIRCLAPGNPLKLLTAKYESLKITLEDGTEMRDYTHPDYIKLVYVYAEAEGNNLRDVLSLVGIDREHTISNDLTEIVEVLGIQAARNFIAHEIMQSLETLGSKVHHSHVLLIADNMTRTATIQPFNYEGLNRNAGTLTNIGFERVAGQLKSSAPVGTSEDISSVSTQIITGRVGTFGTGAIDVFTDPNDVNNPLVSSVKPKGPIVIPIRPQKSTTPGIASTTTPQTLNTVRPNVMNVATSNVATPMAADIIRRRQQALQQQVNTVVTQTSTVCSGPTYIIESVDVPLPTLSNLRPDMFNEIAASIDLFTLLSLDTIRQPQVQTSQPARRLVTPFSRPPTLGLTTPKVASTSIFMRK